MVSNHAELPKGNNYTCPLCGKEDHCAYCHRPKHEKEKKSLEQMTSLDDVRLSDGWHDGNPNKATCDECGSINLRFCFQNGNAWQVECKDCGWYVHDPK